MAHNSEIITVTTYIVRGPCWHAYLLRTLYPLRIALRCLMQACIGLGLEILEHMSAWDCSRRIFTATCKFQLMSGFWHTHLVARHFIFTLTERHWQSMHVVLFLHSSLSGTFPLSTNQTSIKNRLECACETLTQAFSGPVQDQYGEINLGDISPGCNTKQKLLATHFVVISKV